MTKCLKFVGLKESMYNIKHFNCETVVLKECELQNYKGSRFNSNLKNLTLKRNFYQNDRFYSIFDSLRQIMTILPEDKRQMETFKVSLNS